MGTRHSVDDFSESYREVVRTELESILDTCPPSLRNMLRYHMGWQDEQGHRSRGESGKFVRSTLCLLSCQAVGSDMAQIIPAAAAVELIHNFSLIHDDIEDASAERHHRPTVWKVWGQSQAINAGDAMFTLAYLALLRLRDRGTSDEKVAAAIEILGRACLDLCQGQYLDVDYEHRLDITIESYLEMATGKTAALFAAAASLGAYLGGSDDRLTDSFGRFGRELGIAYQICDDILGIWGAEKSIGKSAGDIVQRKKTLPVVYGLQNTDGEARERLERLYSRKTIKQEDVKGIIGILERSGARDHAEHVAEQHYRRALALLEATGLDTYGQAPLKEVARSLTKRDF